MAVLPDPWSLPYGPHLYLHIPFCRARCRYCDFVSYAGCEDLHIPYAAALAREIALAEDDLADAPPGPPTLYIGGGTPSVLPLAALESILDTCARVLDLSTAEITLEANPGTLAVESLHALRTLGVNRLSLGVQSFSDAALRLLGRIHSAAEARQAVALARATGLDSVGLDLIYGLPGQTLREWQRDLEEALFLAPEHLSLYCLTLEQGTPLARAVSAGELPAHDEDVAADMLLLAEERLDAAGYVHYELSNWARPGHVSRHNIAYWRNEDYRGCGVAAHSHRGRRRWANTSSLQEYLEALERGLSAPVEEAEELDPATAMGEAMMLGLRLLAGVPYDVFRERYGQEMQSVYGAVVAELAGQGLLEQDDRGVRLSARGRLLGNQVFACFLP